MPEEIIMKFNPTRWAFFKCYFFAFVLIILAIILFFNLLPIKIPADYKYYPLSLVPTGILLIIIAEVRIKLDNYLITQYRIIEKRGLLSTSEVSMTIDRIANYTTHQSFLDKIINVGTIEIEGVGGDEAQEIVIKRAANVKNIKELIEKLIEISKGR